jgi:hypothetical protein
VASCFLSTVKETSPCCICGRPVHHVCSNELCSDELSIPRANGNRVWNVERLCPYIDVRQWFVETDECAFPMISMLS